MRLFIAIRPPDKILNKIMWITGDFDDCRWVRRKNVHLTLFFIGEADEDKAEEIKDSLANIVVKPFSVRLRRCGVFPCIRKARVLWIGVEQSHDLMKLQKNIVKTMKNIGIDNGEKQYIPHITVGRARRHFKRRNIENWLKQHKGFECQPFQVESFQLYHSTLTPDGPVYEELM